jgi:hypothetical protein
VRQCDASGGVKVWLCVAQSEGVAADAAEQLLHASGASMPLWRGLCGGGPLARGPASLPNVRAGGFLGEILGDGGAIWRHSPIEGVVFPL